MDSIILIICLGVIVAIISILILYHRNVSSKHPTIRSIRRRLSYINPNFLKIPIKIGSSAYTENKSVIYVCLDHPVTGERYDMNTLMYVTLHELAHVITPNYDNHGKEWQNNFIDLLNKAQKLGLYDPLKSIPKDYCAIESRGK
ncbi:MAG: hypothetical protein DRP08_05700 [Candidatus Aenigmatarchaeota archaeon]|nr:MAG: hypothetical protein DRP08_05700 [Candidatus Aenigmarchaeota archaeon]